MNFKTGMKFYVAWALANGYETKLTSEEITLAVDAGWTLHEIGDGGSWGWRSPLGDGFRQGFWRCLWRSYYNDQEVIDSLQEIIKS